MSCNSLACALLLLLLPLFGASVDNAKSPITTAAYATTGAEQNMKDLSAAIIVIVGSSGGWHTIDSSISQVIEADTKTGALSSSANNDAALVVSNNDNNITATEKKNNVRMLVTSSCGQVYSGPASGFPIRINVNGLAANTTVMWRLVHANGTKTQGPWGTFMTNGTGGFDEPTYIEGLPPDTYKVLVFNYVEDGKSFRPSDAAASQTIRIVNGSNNNPVINCLTEYGTAAAASSSAISPPTNISQRGNITGSINVFKVLQDNVKVSFTDAANTAQKQVSGGTVVGGHLGIVQRYLVYTFTVIDTANNTAHMVIVDAGNGKVLYNNNLDAFFLGDIWLAGW